MPTCEINVSMKQERCAQCGKIGKGMYQARNDNTKYICQKCVIKNIKCNQNK